MCWKSKNRKTPAIIVTVLSVIVMILGIAMAIESYVFQTSKSSILSADFGAINDSIKKYRTMASGALLLFSVLVIAIGAAGASCLARPCSRYMCLPMTYGICLVAIWLIVFIVGLVLSWVGLNGLETLEIICEGVDVVKRVNQQVNDYNSHFMCSSMCPCVESQSKQWMSLSEGELNKWRRTKNPGIDFQDSNGNYRLVSVNDMDPTPTYNTFRNCSDALQSTVGQKPAVAIAAGIPIQSNLDNIDTGVKIFTYFEKKYKCSGICTKALFFYTLELNAGMPTESCLPYMNLEIATGLLYIGITWLVAGLIMIIVWVFQYFLWKSTFDNYALADDPDEKIPPQEVNHNEEKIFQNESSINFPVVQAPDPQASLRFDEEKKFLSEP